MIDHQPVLSPTLPYLVRLTRHPPDEQVNHMRAWCGQQVGKEGSFMEAYGEAVPHPTTRDIVEHYADEGGQWFCSHVMGNRVWRFRSYDTAFAFSMRWS